LELELELELELMRLSSKLEKKKPVEMCLLLVT
jgi:hypothetical protein